MLLQPRRARGATQLGHALQPLASAAPLLPCSADLTTAGRAATTRGNDMNGRLETGSAGRVTNEVTHTDTGNKTGKSSTEQHPGIQGASGKR